MLLIAIVTVSVSALAQVYTMSNSSVSTSSGTFYDSGGAGSNYSNNQDLTYTFCPSTPGTAISMEFTAFNVRSGDTLHVYDGTTTTVLKTYRSNLNTTTSFTITSSDPSGCLTFNFTSNGGSTRSGWQASISLVDRENTISDGVTENLCGGEFSDTGGAAANYSDGELIQYTLCPTDPSGFSSITFTSFDVEAINDQLAIYDGIGTGSLIGAFSNANNPNGNTYTSTAPGGCLTFVFTSNISITGAGWIADISCVGIAENCSDGIDNDYDGFVDCYDPDCSGVGGCPFLGVPDPVCQFTPTPQDFEIEELWATTTVMDARQTPVVGDIDGDGTPEVVAKSHNGFNRLYVFDGVTGALEVTINSPRSDTFNDAVAIGDTDGDGRGEIFFVSGHDNAVADSSYLYCYENTGALKWKSSARVGYEVNDCFMSPQLADMNQDGTAEVLVGNKIYNSLTGVLLAEGGTGMREGSHPASRTEAFPVAVDILPDDACPTCSGLELVVGDQVLAVDLSNPTPTAALTIAVDFSDNSAGVRPDGFTSVADMDFDGDLDVIVCSRGTSGGGFNNRGLVYIWEGQSDELMGGPYRLDQCSAGTALQGATANTNTGGHPNIADFNGDGSLEIGLAGKFFYVVLDYNSGTNTLTELWSTISADGSERTGSSVFDFEGDGANEVVYRDEDTLYVYNGTDGGIKAAIYCTSPTRTEYPVVADVTGDGETNICVTCNSQVKVFSAVSQPWVKARKVWNQHNYFVTNVNDDLTIPQQQQNHSVGLPQGSPTNYPFNSFLTQITQLNTDGDPIYEAQDLAINSIAVDGTDCGTLSTLEVTVELENLGTLDYPAGSKIAFYIGNPNTTAASIVVLENTTAIITAGSTSTQLFDVPSTCFTGDLYAVINDNGTIDPPFTSPGSTYAECDYSNNVAGTAYVCADQFVVTCPGNVTASASAGNCERSVSVPAPTASSACGTVTLVNDFNNTDDASDTYPAGVTTVSWTVTDGSGTSFICLQSVTINDNQDPVISCPATQIFNLTGSCTFLVPDYTGLAIASDNCSAVISQVSPAIGASQTGPYTVALRATDAAGNTDDCTFDVVIGTDHDGDCTSDVNDLDDDNDGIPDIQEGICPPYTGPERFADAVLLYDGQVGIAGYASDPTAALGAPDYDGNPSDDNPEQYVSMGTIGKRLMLGFTDNVISNSGDAQLDIQVVEVGPAVESTDLLALPNPATKLLLDAQGVLTPDADGYYPIGTVAGAIDALDIDAATSFAFGPGELQFTAVKLLSNVSSTGGTAGPDIDAVEAMFAICIALDSDGDNVPDYQDLDSDNDGIFDVVEAGHEADDINLDGVIDGAPALFGDNGLFDGIESAPDSGMLDQFTADSDGDGIIDSIELDSDNDGCYDVIEAGYIDSDGNGLLGEGN